MAPPQTQPSAASHAALFTGFLTIGLLGFGGVAPWTRHVIVTRRAWLGEHEYAALLGLGQVLPGANTVNVAVMIGDRFQGPAGALAAVAGLMAMPLLILLAFASVYDAYATWAPVRTAIGGASSACAGLVIGTALKMLRRLRLGSAASGSAALVFAAVGLLHLPMVACVLTLGPLSIALAARTRRRAGA